MELKPIDYRCRVCLTVTEHALYLEESISGSVETLSYMDVLMLCCNIKISLDDGKPKKICLECMEHARTSYEFKICCEHSNSILENEVYIGNIKNEDAYDSFVIEPSSNDMKDLIVVSNKKHATDLDKTTILNINLVIPPISKYVEDITNLDGTRHKTDNLKLEFGEHDQQMQNNQTNEGLTALLCKCGKSYQSRQEYNEHIEKCKISDSDSHPSDSDEISTFSLNGEKLSELKNTRKLHMEESPKTAVQENVNISEDTNKQDKMQVCSICGKSYQSRSGLYMHKKKCSTNVHKCSTCALEFNSFGTLSMHIRKKHVVVGKCSYCETILVDYQTLIVHTKEHHSDKLRGSILCDICGAVFIVRTHLRKHREKVHKILHKCNHCDFSSTYYEGFLHHMRDEHGVIKMVEGKEFSKCGDIRKCEYCNYTTTVMVKFGKHMKMEHEDKKSVVCDQCGIKFFTHRQLSTHYIYQHRSNEKQFICEVCGRQFLYAENLKRHMFIHTGERPYKCKFCEKGFAQSSTLESHIQMAHNEERNVKCNICGKRFKTKRCLTRHNKRKHTRQFDYKCPVCDKAFFCKGELHHHSVVHTGLRLFKCEVCKRGFGRRDHLKTHMRTHTGEKPHVCHVCEKGFSQAHCLRTHLLKHSNMENKTDLKM